MSEQGHSPAELVTPRVRDLAAPVLLALALGVVVTVVLAGYTAHGQNELARRQSEHLAASMIAGFEMSLATQAVDYSYWDDAVANIVRKLDPVWADVNFGDYLAENFEVETFVIDDEDQPIYGWFGGEARLGNPLTLFTGGTRRLVDKAREGERTAAPVPATGLVTDGTDVLVAVASEMMDYTIVDGMEVNEPTGSVLVLVRRLTPELLSSTSTRYLLDELTLVNGLDDRARPRLFLTAVDGTKLGGLRWTGRRPGDATLAWVVPGMVFAFVLMALCTLIFMRRVRTVVDRLGADIAARQGAEQALAISHQELESRVAARTDQLRLANTELEAEIEAHRASELARRPSEERFRDFASSAADWFWETDAEHKRSFVSEGVRECSGAAPGTLAGRRPDAALDRLIADRESLDRWMKLLERGDVIQNHRLDFVKSRRQCSCRADQRKTDLLGDG